MNIAEYCVGFNEIPNKILLNIYCIGCKKNCDGCHNRQLRNFLRKGIFLSNEYFKDIVDDYSDVIDGVCWLGGDAIYQEKRFIELSEIFKEIAPAKLNVLYTGENFENLSQNITNKCDIIKCGEWTGKPVSDINTNQRFYKKTDNEWKSFHYLEL